MNTVVLYAVEYYWLLDLVTRTDIIQTCTALKNYWDRLDWIKNLSLKTLTLSHELQSHLICYKSDTKWKNKTTIHNQSH